jgi:hypothetical protein
MHLGSQSSSRWYARETLLQMTSGSIYSFLAGEGGIEQSGENNIRGYSQHLVNKIVYEIL